MIEIKKNQKLDWNKSITVEITLNELNQLYNLIELVPETQKRVLSQNKKYIYESIQNILKDNGVIV